MTGPWLKCQLVTYRVRLLLADQTSAAQAQHSNMVAEGKQSMARDDPWPMAQNGG